VGLHRRRPIDLESIGDAIGSPEDNQLAQAHADAAVALVKNEGALLPLRSPAGSCYVVLTENRFGTQGRRFLEELRRRRPEAAFSLLDPDVPPSELEAAAARVAACNAIVVAAFAGVASYRGDVALAGGYSNLVETVISSGKPVAMISLGNPYLLRTFPGVSAYLATFSTTPTSEVSAIKALFGEIAIRGRLPMSIPGVARIGDGIQLPAW
jgi:beta-N-acetylhexosaminidase